jgi:hypothetical protein
MIFNRNRVHARLEAHGYFGCAPANDNYPLTFIDEVFWSEDWGGASGP